MKIINTSQAMPKPGRYVLAWMEGAKIPMRAMWAAQHTLPLGDDADPEWGEYSEEKDEYFCPAGWYEMNQHEEQHWGVDGNVVAWCELPRLDAVAAPAAVAPQGEYPQLPEGVMCIEQVGGEVIGRPTDYGFKHGRGIVHGAELFTSEQLRAYFDLGRQSAPAAPALEAPAAPALPAAYQGGMFATTPDGGTVTLRFSDASAGEQWFERLTDGFDALAAAPQAPAAPSMLPNGWVPCILTHDGQHPEEVAYGPQIMMDRLKKWLGRYFELLAQKVLAEPVQAEMLAALQAVAMEVVHVGAGENAVSDSARAKVEAVLEKIGAPWPGPAAAPAEPASKRIGQIVNPASEQSQDMGTVVVAEIMSNGYNGQVLWKGKVPPVGTLLYAAPQAAPAAPAVDASGAVPVVLGKKLFQFSCHQDWVNRAQRAWKMASVRSEDTICLDQKGRVLRKGLEFARADKEGAFPVVVYLALVDDTAAHDAWLAAQAAAKGEHDE